MNDETENPKSAEPTPSNWERGILERVLMASIDEQRRARRWGIFFKSLLAIYVLGFLLVIAWGSLGETQLAGRHTALVDLDGVIAPDSESNADNVITGLRAAFESKATAGVILRTNSPGGSPVQAAYISDEIHRLRETYPAIPFYAVIGDICASGCYYAVAGADKIFASPSSIVGSIGVLMDGFGFVDGMKKLGVERRLLTAGENKGIMDPFSPLDPKARVHVQTMLDEIHQQFIETVKKGRGEALHEDDKNLFSGLFWTGARAKELGLVDEFGSAGYVAREVIKAEDIVDFTYRENLLDRFAERIGAAMANTMAAAISGAAPSLR